MNTAKISGAAKANDTSVISNNQQMKMSAPAGILGYDKMFKIILIGESATGKTSIVNRFVEN